MRIKRITFSILALLITLQVSAQQFDEKAVVDAMKQELDRNMKGLELPGHPKPFFMSYSLGRESITNIQASMGSIIESYSNDANRASVRLLVGDYNRTSETMYGDGNPIAMGRVALDATPDAVKRVFWGLSDEAYKTAIDRYTQKMNFLKNNPRTGKMANIADFQKVETKSYLNPSPAPLKMDVKKWEENLRVLSSIFNNYKLIDNSAVSIHVRDFTIYMVTSEGTVTKTPHQMIAFVVRAISLKPNGDFVHDDMSIESFSLEEMPSMDELKTKIDEFAKNLLAMGTAEPIDKRYIGPVLFDNGLASDMLYRYLFGGLVASRPSDRMSSLETMSDRMGEKIIDSRLSVTNYTNKKEHNGKKLIGHYEIDAQGVEPIKEQLLIEEGKVKSLINGRIPAPGAENSTGSSRWDVNNMFWLSTAVAPGVVHISAKKTTKESAMKKELLKMAKKQKLEYAYIVRTLSQSASLVYRVNVKTGEEVLVSDAILDRVDLDKMRDDIAKISAEEMVVNSTKRGTITSMIYPKSMIINDVTIMKKNSTSTRAIQLTPPLKR